jgi:hypothetical protein
VVLELDQKLHPFFVVGSGFTHHLVRVFACDPPIGRVALPLS